MYATLHSTNDTACDHNLQHVKHYNNLEHPMDMSHVTRHMSHVTRHMSHTSTPTSRYRTPTLGPSLL